MIPRVTAIQIAGPHSLKLKFQDGLEKQVNLLSLLTGPIFQPLLDPAFFKQVLLDPVAGTVVWPNGADVAPETLYRLPEEQELRKPTTSERVLRGEPQRATGAGKVSDAPATKRRAAKR